MIIPVKSFISLNKTLQMIRDSPDRKSCKELRVEGFIYCTSTVVTIYMAQTKPAVSYFTL